jgi:hypothetical protein
MGGLVMSDSVKTFDKSEINSNVPDKFALLCSASFEERSTTIPLSLDINKIFYARVFKSNKYDNSDSTGKICGKIENIEKIELDFNYPIAVAKTLTEIVKVLSSIKDISLVVDITTFTHEILAMLLKLLYENKQCFSSIKCLYNSASDYSNSKEIGPEKMWLTKGCSDVRNVVGYPGRFRPVEKTSLVIFTGFELERATRMIELLEPDKILFGKGTDSIDPNHNRAIEYFHSKFDEWKKNYKHSNCKDIGFSCKNIDETIKIITELVSNNPDDNYILVPLNTKLSTIAVSIVALNDPRIQICYPIPETYNTESYSSPSDKITMVDLFKIDKFNKKSV